MGIGTTGIAWNPRFIQTPVTSINELWNPAYHGRVGMLADIQDVGNVGMLTPTTEPLSAPQRAASGWRHRQGADNRGQPVPLLPADHRRPDPLGRI